MRTYVRDIVDITSSDVSDSTMNTFIREGYNLIVYSEKRWPFYEVALSFTTVGGQSDYPIADIATNLSITHDGVSFSGAGGGGGAHAGSGNPYSPAKGTGFGGGGGSGIVLIAYPT